MRTTFEGIANTVNNQESYNKGEVALCESLGANNSNQLEGREIAVSPNQYDGDFEVHRTQFDRRPEPCSNPRKNVNCYRAVPVQHAVNGAPKRENTQEETKKQEQDQKTERRSSKGPSLSPVGSVVVMVAFTVILAAVIGTIVLQVGSEMSPNIEVQEN